MPISLKKSINGLKTLQNILIPSFIRFRIDAEVFGIIKFMKFVSKKIRPTDKILDAGAGSSPYKTYFSHGKYESTDFDDIFDKSSRHKHNFICSLDKIPKKTGSYDVVNSYWRPFFNGRPDFSSNRITCSLRLPDGIPK